MGLCLLGWSQISVSLPPVRVFFWATGGTGALSAYEQAALQAIEFLQERCKLRSRREQAIAEVRGYEGGQRSGIANRFAAEWESPTALEPKSHDHAPTSPSLNEGSLVAKNPNNGGY
ncbi:hypothetical protein CFC21_034606 [Triticum aestivum]|uniref:Uncharacterized protein n=3 Tax=Triticum TaxID=4564 RepID=A0A9R0VIZ4_TRITD|nr:hypothetical protein CFC21_034606 [Triticum aestivum]VAH58885.1 unnamed protein product [Triticum turgidum subsp. durum]